MKAKLVPVYWIVRREVLDQIRDWRILFPMIVLSLFFPVAMFGIARATVNFINRYGANLVIEQLVPFSILVVGFFPSTLALSIALESIAGERDRNTIEPLLSVPLEDWQLYLGKLISGAIAPLVAVTFAITLYLLLIARRDIPIPSPQMIALLYLLGLDNTLLMVTGATFISAQSTSVRSATLSSSFIVLPASFLVQMEAYFLFWKNSLPILWIALFGFIATLMFLRLGLAYFDRENLLGREIDSLNFKRYGRLFWENFRGEARSIWEWYRRELPLSLREVRYALLLFLALFPVGVGLGIYVADKLVKPYVVREASTAQKDVLKQIDHLIFNEKGETKAQETEQQTFSIGMGTIFSHNLRATVAALFIAIATLGTMGTLAYLLNIALLGLVWRGIEWMGLPPLQIYLLGVFPHGIFEIPAILLSFSSAFYLGARLITPSRKPLSVTLIESLALWTRLFIGIVLPLLLIAATIESTLTKYLLENYVKLLTNK